MTIFSDITGTYGNNTKTLGVVLPLGYNGGVAFGADANTTLTTLDLRRQVITPTASRNYTLPTGALELQGDTWTFINLSTTASVVLKASDATTITTVVPGRTVQIFAKQDNPTTNTHWVNIGGISITNSQVSLVGANGYGSTNTTTRRWTSSTVVGSDITYVDDAALGGQLTAVTSGVYAISATEVDSISVSASLGITRNSSDGTANVDALPSAEVLSLVTSTAVNTLNQISWVGNLSASDLIGVQTYGNASGGNGGLIHVTMTKISL